MRSKEVDEYIKGFPAGTAAKLQQLRKTIIQTAPEAEEIISYKMPAYKYFGMLVYFAGYDHHIGFYPGVSAIIKFKKKLALYKGAKGSVQFPLDMPLPLQTIKEIIMFRLKENKKKTEMKKKDKK